MKAKTQNTMQALLQGILDRMKKVENFTLEQAPDICKEIVNVEVIQTQNETLVASLSALVTGTISALAIRYALTAPFVQERYGDGQTMSGLAIMSSIVGTVTLVVSVIALGTAFCSALRLREIKAGPKLLIIEKLSKLIKKV